MNNTLKLLELTQESHQLLENLSNRTLTRYNQVKRELAELECAPFKPLFKFPIQ